MRGVEPDIAMPLCATQVAAMARAGHYMGIRKIYLMTVSIRIDW